MDAADVPLQRLDLHWAVTLAGGTHVCLRRVEPALIFAAIAEHGVTHMCGAPVVLSMLIHAPASAKRSSLLSGSGVVALEG
jgi:acyl-coenzyme A synthetase/AMP-(fatty) acid ligase